MNYSAVSIEQAATQVGTRVGGDASSRAPATGNGKLSKQDSIVLLQKLATDDGFRSRFERSPMAALVELGLPHDTVVNCLSPQTLASKAAFEAVLKQFHSENAEASLRMVAPMAKLQFGRN